LSIYKFTKKVKYEIIVIDNDSSDGSVEMVKKEFPKVKLITNNKNLYFTKANNQALEIAKGKYFLILNSDTYFINNSIEKMFDYMEKNKDTGACEGLELYESRKTLNTGSKFSTPLIDFYELSLIGSKIANKRLINNYRITDKDREDTFEIEVGCDAFLMVKTLIMKKIKGYDERLLLYYTENDLCLRIKKLGFKIIHLGKAEVIHKVSASVKKLNWKRIDIYYQDLLHYYIKHGFIISGFLLFFFLKCEETLLRIIKR